MHMWYTIIRRLDEASFDGHMREWLSGRASPCQGERREFESRLPLYSQEA